MLAVKNYCKWNRLFENYWFVYTGFIDCIISNIYVFIERFYYYNNYNYNIESLIALNFNHETLFYFKIKEEF